jgi:hypothetical protein
MRRTPSLALVFLLASTALAGCAIDSRAPTSPTFVAARPIPAPSTPPPQAAAAIPKGQLSGMMPGGTAARPGTSVASAIRSAVIYPTADTMQGGTWVIDRHYPTQIYDLPVAPNHVTTVLLPPGEKYNANRIGNAEGFLLAATYVGPRPAISILPRQAGVTGNLQIATTADEGLYLFRAHTTRWPVEVVDIRSHDGTDKVAAADPTPQPQGDFTSLTFFNPDGGKPLAAWAPVEAWADSYKMVIRFNGPLPVLPGLYAGQQGEQFIGYRTVMVAGTPFLVTSRRVTEAELRLGDERIRLTVDNGTPAAQPGSAPVARDDTNWSTAQALPQPAAPPSSNVAVFVMPGQQQADTFGASIDWNAILIKPPAAPAPPAPVLPVIHPGQGV